jgi:hypothetical protein
MAPLHERVAAPLSEPRAPLSTPRYPSNLSLQPVLISSPPTIAYRLDNMAAEVSHAPASVPSVPAQGVAYRPPRLCSSEQFDPVKHLCFKNPSKRYTMKELGLEGQGIGPIALTEPFPLFTPAAVNEFRKGRLHISLAISSSTLPDVLSDRVLDEYTVSSNLAARQAREYNPVVAPFLCSAFSSPEATALVSAAAGIELVPIMQLELGNTNYMCGKSTSIEELKNLPIEPSKPFPELSNEQKAEFERNNDLSKERQVVDWHFDRSVLADRP